MKATLKFPSRPLAVKMATLWSRRTTHGHTVSATRPDGSCEVTLYGVTEEDKTWIEATAESLATPTGYATEDHASEILEAHHSALGTKPCEGGEVVPVF